MFDSCSQWIRYKIVVSGLHLDSIVVDANHRDLVMKKTALMPGGVEVFDRLAGLGVPRCPCRRAVDRECFREKDREHYSSNGQGALQLQWQGSDKRK